ncbi:hypothetical protein [Aliiroseovarius sp. F47248L]|uniref:hypothetical protein n=1 Tax=Aliiroseovarius sp. F47248L TaxID=2926420 RepID=UPI001FF2D348|nr:hypothetical protein [Aliiroseovarius sp. F47248L]MCK0139995.1 hypothetical protein [Aliiroseovarius sp. F47248L]
MPKFCAIRMRHLILLLPFGYAFVSRYHWPRDFMVNALTAWVPGIILVALLGDLTVSDAFICYLMSYTAFICIYELGYLANDTIGLRHDPTPRRRVDTDHRPGFIICFVALRLGIGLAATVAVGVATSALYWASLSTLIATLIAHNTLRAIELKFYTFLQLSLLRFTLPVLPALLINTDTTAILTSFATALLLFTLPRFVTYLDAKGRLILPERKAQTYHLKTQAAVIPLVILLSVLTDEIAPLICLIWGVIVQLVYVARGRLPLRALGVTQS